MGGGQSSSGSSGSSHSISDQSQQALTYDTSSQSFNLNQERGQQDSNTDLNNAVSDANLEMSLLQSGITTNSNTNSYVYDEVTFENYDEELLSRYQDITNRTVQIQQGYANNARTPTFVSNIDTKPPDYESNMTTVRGGIDKYFNDGDVHDNPLAKDLAIAGAASLAVPIIGQFAALALFIAAAVEASNNDYNNSSIPNDIMNNANRFANEAKNTCNDLAPDGSGDSKNNWYVHHLRNYYDKGSNSGNLWGVSETLRVFIESIPQSTDWKNLVAALNSKTDSLNANATAITNNTHDLYNKYNGLLNLKKTIDTLVADINALNGSEVTNIQNITNAMTADKAVHDKKIADYDNKKQLLEQDIQKLINEMEPRLNSTLADTRNNKEVIDRHNNFVKDHIDLNKQQVDYLNKKKLINQNISIQNYEELYKAVILQNEILKNTLTETNNRLNFADREAELYDKKNIFTGYIYKYLFVIYFLIVFLVIIFFIFYERQLSYTMTFLFLILIISYPFRILYLELILYNLIKYVASIMTGSIFTYTPLY
jgi:hypothetical protein